MQCLNLINSKVSDISDISDISYDVFRFPDGEVHIKLGEINRKDSVSVICRITNADELFLLMQVGDILNRHCVDWYLSINYLMSMRMDRVISFNESFSLKVVADMINSLHPRHVDISHPHSIGAIRLLDNSFADNLLHPNSSLFGSMQLCYPDAGACERYESVYDSDFPVLVGEKVRNKETGKIESITIKNPEDYKGIPVMVIDDLCDAGGTFMGIAKAIRDIDSGAALSISVFHMVNRIGIDNLSKGYDKVYFTNSYRDWDNLPENCKMIEL